MPAGHICKKNSAEITDASNFRQINQIENDLNLKLYACSQNEPEDSKDGCAFPQTQPFTEGESEVFIQRLLDDKCLKHISGCPYKLSHYQFVVKFSAQADQKLGRNKYLHLLGNEFVRQEDLWKIKDDRSYDKWQHTCNGR